MMEFSPPDRNSVPPAEALSSKLRDLFSLLALILALGVAGCTATGPREENGMAYQSIIETMRTEITGAPLLSTVGPVPGLVTIPSEDFLANALFFGLSEGDVSNRFDIRDVPAIKEIGVFSSLADGLAPQVQLPPFSLSWVALDAGGNVIDTLASVRVNFEVLNTLRVYDVYRIFNSDTARQKLKAATAATSTAIAFNNYTDDDWIFGAYSMDAAWNTQPLKLFVQATVEHTFPLID